MTTSTDQHDPQPPAHSSHLEHHFASMRQQYEAGRLGMWIFLATELLLFGGLFCAYAVYRSNHPEVFEFAHRYLDKTLGGINTAVLICSSLTMAWAVRCAQRGRTHGLKVLLILTLLCAGGFLGIKFIEYEHKWKHGLLWGREFRPHGIPGMPSLAPHPPSATQAATTPATAATRAGGQKTGAAPATSQGASAPGAPPTAASRPATPAEASARADRPLIPPAAEGPRGLAVPATGPSLPHRWPSNVHIFFGVYFLMTGLHALHVIAGMTAITWLLVRTFKGHFSSEYFGPVDSVGLYWHLVDIIWIYLFPLLYLIH
jgi:cytochrome c oxidase subunit III